MNARYAKADAVVIRSIDFSDSSEIITFYTREYGKVTVLAKGVRRKSSRITGHVDLFSRGEIVFTTGSHGRRLDILTEADAREKYSKIRKNIDRFYAACHAAEIVNMLTAPEDPDSEIFDELVALLRALNTTDEPALPLFAFEVRLLVHAGFMPQLSACVSCGRAIKGKSAMFSVQRGGVLCEKCSPTEYSPLEKVPAGVLSLLDRLAKGTMTKFERVKLSPQARRQTREFLSNYESGILSRELRTRYF